MNYDIAIVLGSFHKKEVNEMLDEVRTFSQGHDLNIIEEVWVPGSMEKPLALKRLLLNSKIDGAVVLGVIERGETKHGLVMGQVAINAIIQLQLEFMKPVGVGILGPEILPDIIQKRIRPYALAAVKAVREMLISNK
ncbi:MAG: 6,7-dimethyl-8-ribityllumazine synthase [Thiomargarita sp.]|nr:6,7-dimethyl-8-ribityllumazine synthase [Thiomargarita sp.]